MGEYTNHDGQRVKIGTCESMYYLRYEDRHRVEPLPNNVDPARDAEKLRFRLPFPDEDGIGPGGYQDYNRSVRLWRKGKGDFTDPELLKDPGRLQLRHEPSGLLVSVKCFHGLKLPETGGDFDRVFWNGKGHSLELAHVRPLGGEMFAVVHCRHCGSMWRYPLAEILPWVGDETLRTRLEAHLKD